MKAWNILLDGKPYSMVYTGKKDNAEQAISDWKTKTAFSTSEACLDAVIGNRKVTAEPFIDCRLNYYGTKRNG